MAEAGLSDSVGFVTDYDRCDDAYAAIQAAEHVRRFADVAFYSATPPRRLHGDFDGVVASQASAMFTDWLSRVRPRLVVWTRVYSRPQVEYVAATGAKTALIASCCEETSTICGAYPKFDHLLAGRAAIRAVLDGYRIAATPCPWSPCATVTRKAGVRAEPKVVVPLQTRSQRLVDRAVFGVFGQVLAATNASIELQIAGLSNDAVASLVKMRKRPGFRRRLRVLPAADYHGQLLAMADADLVLSLSPLEPAAATAAMASAMGTPVVAWATPPAAEVVDDGVNGVLVPHGCDAVADCIRFGEAVQSLLESDGGLANMVSAASRVAGMRADWERVWNSVLASAGLA